jgi:biotin carboxyl carrier protein
VIAIEVAMGQPVRAGDVLLTLEAMKMELPIRSPRDGVVAAIRCAPGELVQPGLPLVELA